MKKKTTRKENAVLGLDFTDIYIENKDKKYLIIQRKAIL